MAQAEQLTAFYPDLLDERFISNFAIYHQRYSTNTFPTWRLAQPFRLLAHNGEINTLTGNTNWMMAHEPKMASAAFGDDIEDIRPIIQAGSSDSEALDAFYRLHLLTRRRLGVPIQPRKFFRGVQRWLIANGLAFVGLVKKQDAIIAAGVFLTYI